MKKIYLNILTLIFLIINNQAMSNSIERPLKIGNKTYVNVTNTLVNNFGWHPHQIGPFGQNYRIDISMKSMDSFLDLHPLIKKKYGGYKRTSICSILSKGKTLMLSNKDLVDTHYSESLATTARNNYIFKGKNLSEREWQLSDQYTWLTYISEGTGSTYYKQDIFNKPLNIIKCTSHNVTVSNNGKYTTFPNLILTLPDYVFIQNTKSYKKQTNYKKKNVNSVVKQSTDNIMTGIEYLLSTKQWDSYDPVLFSQKLIKSSIKPRNYVLLGGVCKYTKVQKCAKFLNHLYRSNDPDLLLDYAYKKLEAKFKYN